MAYSYLKLPVTACDVNISYVYVNRFLYNCIECHKNEDLNYNAHIFVDNEDIDNSPFYQEFEIYIKKIVNIDKQQWINEKDDDVLNLLRNNQKGIFCIEEQNHGDVLYSIQKVYLNFYHYNTLVPHRDKTYECLFCDIIVDNMQDCRKHVETDSHKTCLENQGYVEKFTNNIIRHVRSHYFHCGICNMFILEHELENHVATNKHDTLKKYAQASAEYLTNNPKTLEKEDINDFKEVQLKDVNVFLPIRYWHTYFVFPRRAFCSLCIFSCGIDFLKDHLESLDHKNNLKRCLILSQYGAAVVRTINKDYLHCGACNAYVPHSVISVHIDKDKHKSKVLTLLKMNCKLQNCEMKEKLRIQENYNQKKITGTATYVKKSNNLINEHVFVTFKGFHFYIDYLSYNTIMRIRDGFKCISCDEVMVCSEVNEHINMDEHKKSLESMEAIDDYPLEFMRKKSMKCTWVHCGLCNIRVVNNPKNIKNHFDTANHKKNFKKHADTVSMKKQENSNSDMNSETLFYKNKIGKYIQEVDLLGKKYELKLLSYKAWHTIKEWDMYFSCCYVCQTLVVNEDICKHLKSREHKENLNSCVLLECYGINYLRIINWDHYTYCSFCNDKIGFNEIDSHVNSGIHVERRKYGIPNNLYSQGKRKLKNSNDFSNFLLKDDEHPVRDTKLEDSINTKRQETCRAVEESHNTNQIISHHFNTLIYMETSPKDSNLLNDKSKRYAPSLNYSTNQVLS